MTITYSKLPVVDPTNRCAICGARVGEPKASDRGTTDWYEKHLSTRCSRHRGDPTPGATRSSMELRPTTTSDNKHAQKVMSIITGGRRRATGVRGRRD